MKFLWPSVPAPTDFPLLKDNDVHVWCASLEEKSQEENLKKTHDILRALLGHYLQMAPHEGQILRDTFGKPFVNEANLQFNISHSGEVALYAFTKNKKVGIDVEKIRDDVDIQGLSHRYFTPRESELIASLPSDQRLNAFFKCWTQKEAYIKARGEGLRIPLKEFEVSILPEESFGLQTTNSPWHFEPLKPASGYSAALAIEGFGSVLSYWSTDHAFACGGS